jgi:spermidine/putrescine-binding protein
LRAALACALILTAAACGGDAHDVTSDELDLYTWTSYVPASVIHGFEKKYDLKVKVTYYASNEEAIAGIEDNPGKYDIVIPSDYAVQIMRDRDLLESIDPTTDLRNWGNVDPSFRSPAFDPGSGLRQRKGKPPEPKYTVPYQWGTTGIAYNAAELGFTPRTWDDLARPEVHGNVALVDDNRDVLGAALIANGFDRNDSDPAALAKAASWLESLAPVPVNPDHPAQPLIDGQASIAVMYNGDAAQAMRKNHDIRYVLPDDGSIWFDNLAIPKDAPHRDAALAFMDYVLDAHVGAQITKFFGYSTPNQAALDVLSTNDPAIADNPATNPPRDALLGLRLTTDVGTAGAQRFLDTWKEVSGE